jgi:hypothetical protein
MSPIQVNVFITLVIFITKVGLQVDLLDGLRVVQVVISLPDIFSDVPMDSLMMLVIWFSW